MTKTYKIIYTIETLHSDEKQKCTIIYAKDAVKAEENFKIKYAKRPIEIIIKDIELID